MAGNQHYEFWDEKRATKFFKDSLKKVREDKDIYFVGKLAVEMGWYKQLYQYLINKFGDNNSAFVSIKKQIDAILEARVVDKGYESGGATMSIFQLKNNYDWKDKTEVEKTVKNESDESINERIAFLLGKAGISGSSGEEV